MSQAIQMAQNDSRGVQGVYTGEVFVRTGQFDPAGTALRSQRGAENVDWRKRWRLGTNCCLFTVHQMSAMPAFFFRG